MQFNSIIAIVFLVTGTLLFFLGVIILREKAHQSVNRAASLMFFFAALGPVFAAFGIMLEINQVASSDRTFLNNIFLAWEFLFPQLLIFALHFPVKHRILKAYPRLPLLLYLPQAFHLLLMLVFTSAEQISGLLGPAQWLPGLGIVFEPFRVAVKLLLNSTAMVYRYQEGYFALINLIYVLAALITMQHSFAGIQSIRMRKQMRLVLWGVRVSTGLYAIAFLLPKITFLKVSPWQAYSITSFGLILGAGAIVIAIVRYNFLDIQIILRRGFVFSVASGVLVAAYLILYAETRDLSVTTFGASAKFVQALFLIVAVIAFQPLLHGIESVLDRFFYRNTTDYRDAVEKLGREVLSIFEPEALRQRVVNVLSEVFLVEVVFLMLPDTSGRLQTPAPGNKRAGISRKSEIASILLQEKQPVFLADILHRLQNDPQRLVLHQLRAHVLFPLLHRDALLGILILGRKITRTRFSRDELASLSMLSDQLAISQENLQLYKEKLEKQRIEEELTLAQEIQQSLLPSQWPVNAHFELTAFNIPSRDIGGDYYDFIQRDSQHLGVAIADVAGKGIPGALLMSNLQAVFRAYALRYPAPRLVVAQVNDHLACTTSAEKFVTFFYGVFDSQRMKLTYTNAGHNYPFLCRDGEVTPVDGGDMIIGVKPQIVYHQKVLKLKPGDVLLFYTDGVTEAFNPQGELFGEERVIAILQAHFKAPLQELRRKIYNAVLQFADQPYLADDLTIVLLRIK